MSEQETTFPFEGGMTLRELEVLIKIIYGRVVQTLKRSDDLAEHRACWSKLIDGLDDTLKTIDRKNGDEEFFDKILGYRNAAVERRKAVEEKLNTAIPKELELLFQDPSSLR